MKRIASFFGNIVKVSLLFAVIGVGIVTQANAQPRQAQDLYQIEQTFDHEFKVSQITINSGWDVRLIQTPEGAPTQLVVTTSCAEFFEEGSEPTLMEVHKEKLAKNGGYELKANQWMPRNTVVEIFTSQPIDRIDLLNGSRLTIQHFDFDSTMLDINVNNGAMLIIDTLSNSGTTSIDVHNGTLDLGRIRGHALNILTYGNSHVTEGDIQTSIPHTKKQCKERKLTMLSYSIGLGLATPLWVESNRFGSPYNTNRAILLHNLFLTNAMPINQHLSWHFGLDLSATWAQLDNVVKVNGSSLVLDPSYGATPPRQSLYWWSIGLPVTMNFKFDKVSGGNLFGLYATLTPTVNLKPHLISKSLSADDHWNTDDERVDILNRFNVRATIGLGFPGIGLGKFEFFIDLLPSYNASANAPQTRMFGLNYIFQ